MGSPYLNSVLIRQKFLHTYIYIIKFLELNSVEMDCKKSSKLLSCFCIFCLLSNDLHGKPLESFKIAKLGEYCGPVENLQKPGYVDYITDCQEGLYCSSYVYNGVCVKPGMIATSYYRTID